MKLRHGMAQRERSGSVQPGCQPDHVRTAVTSKPRPKSEVSHSNSSQLSSSSDLITSHPEIAKPSDSNSSRIRVHTGTRQRHSIAGLAQIPVQFECLWSRWSSTVSASALPPIPVNSRSSVAVGGQSPRHSIVCLVAQLILMLQADLPDSLLVMLGHILPYRRTKTTHLLPPLSVIVSHGTHRHQHYGSSCASVLEIYHQRGP
jgi:hypothetical protein